MSKSNEPPFISGPYRESTSDFVRRIASEPRPADEPPSISNTFTCAVCHNTYPKAWTDAEAQAEADEAGFIDQSVIVCDDCYRPMMERAALFWNLSYWQVYRNG